ncbi:hypothetical protein ILYODFUR_012146, partial [Ilyodon furcidens]
SVLECLLDPVQMVGNVFHMHEDVPELEGTFSGRLLQPRCTKDPSSQQLLDFITISAPNRLILTKIQSGRLPATSAGPMALPCVSTHPISVKSTTSLQPIISKASL